MTETAGQLVLYGSTATAPEKQTHADPFDNIDFQNLNP